MKKYLIGRWDEADIVIPDDSDRVSRRHAIATRHFSGKLTLRDISANGTFHQGKRLPADVEVPMRPTDEVSLAEVWDFSLKNVPDPYRSARITLWATAVLLILAAVGAGWWGWQTRQAGSPTPNAPQAVQADSSRTAPDFSAIAPQNAAEEKESPVRQAAPPRKANPAPRSKQAAVPRRKQAVTPKPAKADSTAATPAPRHKRTQASPLIY